MSEANDLKAPFDEFEASCERLNVAVKHVAGVQGRMYKAGRALLAERTEMIDAMRRTIRGYRAGVTPDVMADFIEEMATMAGDPDFPLPPPQSPQPQELPPPRLPPREGT